MEEIPDTSQAQSQQERKKDVIIVNKPRPPLHPKNPPRFVTGSFRSLHGELYNEVFDLILKHGLFFNSAKARETISPFNYQPMDKLKTLIDFSLKKTGVDSDTLFEYYQNILKYSPKHSHPFYLRRTAGLDPYAIGGDLLAATLGTVVLTYLEAPTFTLMEEQVLKSIRGHVGYENSEGDGIICPDVLFSYAIVIKLAMHKKFPEIRQQGLFEDNLGKYRHNLCIFVSGDSSYYWKQAVIIVGLGIEACVTIPTDQNGKLSMIEFKLAFKEYKSKGFNPLMVIGTIGTKFHGACDPILDIQQFCEKNQVWFHCNGNRAGDYIFSPKLKEKFLQGIEKCDSFCLNTSYGLSTPRDCIVLVTKYPKTFVQTFGLGAKLVFGKNNLYDVTWSNGDRTIQTSRRPEIVKLWFCWKAKGRRLIAEHVEYTYDMTIKFVQAVKHRSPAFCLVKENPDASQILFYYVPKEFRGQSPVEQASNETMKQLANTIRMQMLQDGKAVIDVAKLNGYPNCISISLPNSAFGIEDIDYVLNLIEFYGEQILDSDPSILKSMLVKFEHIDFSDNDNEDQIQQFDQISDDEEEEDEQNTRITLPVTLIPPKPPLTYIQGVNSSIESLHKEFFTKLIALIKSKALYMQEKRNAKCSIFRTPEQLLEEFDFSLQDEPITNVDELIKIADKLIYYSIHQGHPYFVYREHSSSLDAYSIMADYLITITSPATNTYEDNPPFYFMEKEVLRVLRSRSGYKADGIGLFCPGGSISGITAMFLARYDKLKGAPQTKTLTLFISESAHYLFVKGSNLLGIGEMNCIEVKSDVTGKMYVVELKKALKKSVADGEEPFMVIATAGTTASGAFDSIEEISILCKKYGCWLHVDGSKGGALILSENPSLLALLKGIEKFVERKSDSFNFNPHKFFGNVQLISIFLANRPEQFYAEALNTSNNPGTFLGRDSCTVKRRSCVMKFWFMWKAKGILGISQHLDHGYMLTNCALQDMRRRGKAFQPWLPRFDCPGIIFLYVPIKLRSLDFNSLQFKKRIGKVSLALQAIIIQSGCMMIATLSEKESPVLMKITLTDSGLTEADVIYLLDCIDFYGKDMDC